LNCNSVNIDNVSASYVYFTFYFEGCSNVDVFGCYSDLSASAVSVYNCSDISIESNRFTNSKNDFSTINIHMDGMTTSTNITVESNYVKSSSYNALRFDGYSAANPESLIILNNTFVDCVASGIYVRYVTNCIISNNTIKNCGTNEI